MKKSLQKPVVTIFFLLLALYGCAGLGIKELRPGKRFAPPRDKALVTGKIVFVENGKETLPYGIWRKANITLFQIESGKKAHSLSVENDGSFYWVVPRGTYIVSAISHTDAMHGALGSYVVQPKAVFQVPYGADAFYLGTLMVDAQVGEHMLGEHYLKQVNSISVEDQFGEAKGTIEGRNRELAARMEKNLMIHDESIPIDPDLESKKALADIMGIIGLGLIMQYNIQTYP